MQFQRPPFFATLFTFLAVAALCGLGAWQLQRLGWKQDMIGALDRALSGPADAPIEFSLIEKYKDRFARGTLRGRFTGGHVMVGPRMMDGKAGYHVYAPFRVDGGRVILVNRGWAPKDTLAEPRGQIMLPGIVRAMPGPSRFTPPNDPASGKWFHPDAAQIAAHLKLEAALPPVIFQAESAATGGYPVPLPLSSLRPANNHLQYAITWFSLAFVLCIIFGMRFIVKPARNEETKGSAP